VTEPKLVYETLEPISVEAAEAAFRSGTPVEILYAILRLSLHGPDWELAECRALELTKHPDVEVRRNAATALSHVARIQRDLVDVDACVAALQSLLEDPEVADWADISLDEFEIYLGVRRPRPGPDLSSIGYDPTSRTLEVEFADGTIHQYLGVPLDDFEAFGEAHSLKAYLQTWIAQEYECREVKKSIPVKHLPVHEDQLKVA